MGTTVTLVETMFEKAEAYAKTTIELTKLRALETSAKVVTSFVSRISVIVMFSLFALVLNIGIALFLGDLLGKTYYGFFIVAAFYLLAGILLHFYMHKSRILKTSRKKEKGYGIPILRDCSLLKKKER